MTTWIEDLSCQYDKLNTSNWSLKDLLVISTGNMIRTKT